MTKKIFYITLLLFLTTSCVTKYLWGNRKYEERINSILVGENGRYVVLVGQQYHYILTDRSQILNRILLLKQSQILTVNPKKTNIHLDSNNNISGMITMTGPFNMLPLEDMSALTSMGIKPDGNDDVSIKIKVSGRRYAARFINADLARGDKSFVVTVTYNKDSDLATDVGKVAITPLAVGLDAVIFVGKAVVYPFRF